MQCYINNLCNQTAYGAVLHTFMTVDFSQYLVYHNIPLLSMDVLVISSHSTEDTLLHWWLSNSVPALSSKYVVILLNGFYRPDKLEMGDSKYA